MKRPARPGDGGGAGRIGPPPATELAVEAVLLDLDGVLVDSGPAVARHWSAFADRHGFDAERIVRSAQGRRSMDVIAGLLPAEQVADEARWYEELEVADVDGVVAVPGAAALLAALPADRWAVVTSCGADLAAARLAAVGLPTPPRLVTAEQVPKGKPDPAGYRLAAHDLGVDPAATVVFEDAPSGIEAGRRAGATVVAVATGHDPDALDGDVVVADLRPVAVAAAGAGTPLRLRIAGEDRTTVPPTSPGEGTPAIRS